MPQLLPSMKLRNPSAGTCFELFNNCRTLAYIGRLQAGRWRLSDCDDCCPPCIDDGPYFMPSFDRAWWADGNEDPAANEFLGIFAHSVWLEPSSSVRRRGETLLAATAYSPRRLEIVGELVTDSVRGAALAWQSLSDVLSDCGDSGWDADIQSFCPDVGEPSEPDLDAILSASWSEPTVPVTSGDDCDPCRRIDSDVWQATPLPEDDGGALAVADSGSRQLLKIRLVSIDENPDGANIPDCQGVPIKIVFEVFEDASYGDPIPLPCFTNPLREAIDETGATVLACLEDGEPVPAGATVIDECLDTGEPVPAGASTVTCFDDEDLPAASCRPFDWGLACLQPGSVDKCVGSDTAAAIPTVSGSRQFEYCWPMWRRPVSCLIPRLPSNTDGVFDIQVSSGSTELANLRIDLWPAYDNVEDPATCSGERFYRARVPCESWEFAPLAPGSVLSVNGRQETVSVSCLGQSPVAADNLVAGTAGGRLRFPTISPDCRWWLVATFDCDRTADDSELRVWFVPRFDA